MGSQGGQPCSKRGLGERDLAFHGILVHLPPFLLEPETLYNVNSKPKRRAEYSRRDLWGSACVHINEAKSEEEEEDASRRPDSELPRGLSRGKNDNCLIYCTLNIAG